MHRFDARTCVGHVNVRRPAGKSRFVRRRWRGVGFRLMSNMLDLDQYERIEMSLSRVTTASMANHPVAGDIDKAAVTQFRDRLFAPTWRCLTVWAGTSGL